MDNDESKVQYIRSSLRFELGEQITEEDIKEALLYVESSEQFEYTEEQLEKPYLLIKEKEFEKLTTVVNSKELKVEPEWIFEDDAAETNYYSNYFERISRVLRLKETTALYGFDRKDYKNTTDYSSYYPFLYKDLDNAKELWL